MPERLDEALAARRAKLARLRQRGIEPFALRFDGTRPLASIVEQFGGLAPDARTGETATVAGRIVLLRRQGRLSFATIRDATGDLQLFVTAAAMGDRYGIVDDLDLGDIVGATGEVVTTRRGELSVEVRDLSVLSKALRPMPEKFHGLRDPELRYRRRYLEFATDPASRRVIRARAAVLRAARRTLDERGFLEVETPVLQPMASGAMAKPFATRHQAMDLDVFLRIAPELYLKRLLVGGFERVYELGRDFRNEGMDWEHSPEFTMLEIYQAYGDYTDMMEIAEAVIGAAALAVRGSLAFDYGGRELDLTPPWRRVPLLDLVSEAAGEEVTLGRGDLRQVAERHGVATEPSWTAGEVVKALYEKLVEKSLHRPTFVMDFPREISPLARSHRSRPGLTEQFDLVIARMEIGPGYSELTDPDEQRARFLQQMEARARGDEEAHPLDEDFLLALEHGMPPAGGIGIGIDRVTMLMADAASIREVIAFPLMRPREATAPAEDRT